MPFAIDTRIVAPALIEQPKSFAAAATSGRPQKNRCELAVTKFARMVNVQADIGV